MLELGLELSGVTLLLGQLMTVKLAARIVLLIVSGMVAIFLMVETKD